MGPKKSQGNPAPVNSTISNFKQDQQDFRDLEFKPYPVDHVNPVQTVVASRTLEFRQDQQD